MEIEFNKCQAAGNDFILINNMDGRYDSFMVDIKEKKKLCDRHFGIGGDGILEIKSCNDAAYEIVYHTGKGTSAGVCGNGSRIGIMYMTTHVLGKTENITFRADDGLHVGSFHPKTNMVKITMMDISRNITKVKDGYFINVGTPHFIRFVDDIDIDLHSIGKEVSKELEYISKYKVLVNVVKENEREVFPRCYEPNSMKELLACGTGSTAIALAYIEKKNPEVGKRYTVPVNWNGGTLTISCMVEKEKFTNITLSGPAKKVFKGIYNYEK